MIRRLLYAALATSLTSNAWADPCGMVPPIYTGPGVPITRVGPQRTYVFYKDGMETYVIRPGFSGKVEEFGMLIPFPSVPALRKVPEQIFAHLGAAIDPPEIVIDLRPRPSMMASRGAEDGGASNEKSLAYDEVKVLRQEAVGMYEVAVLAAGSATALSRWMEAHGFRYPQGMDAAVNDYVAAGWIFVAEKTRVGSKPRSDPKAGMRSVNAAKPSGAAFDGYVQAMGFRFKVDKPVVPMRLSPFNAGEKRQIVYYLTDKPVRIDGVGDALVRRQLPGSMLHKNVTEPLPLKVLGGTLTKEMERGYRGQRDPKPHNGEAKDLFASDLLALQQGVLNLPHEEKEKELLRIGEALNLRGAELDVLHEAELAVGRDRVAQQGLRDLQALTMTVVDGEFPIQYMQEHDLTISAYEMPGKKNNRASYDAKFDGVAPVNYWGRRGLYRELE